MYVLPSLPVDIKCPTNHDYKCTHVDPMYELEENKTNKNQKQSSIFLMSRLKT